MSDEAEAGTNDCSCGETGNNRVLPGCALSDESAHAPGELEAVAAVVPPRWLLIVCVRMRDGGTTVGLCRPKSSLPRTSGPACAMLAGRRAPTRGRVPGIAEVAERSVVGVCVRCACVCVCAFGVWEGGVSWPAGSGDTRACVEGTSRSPGARAGVASDTGFDEEEAVGRNDDRDGEEDDEEEREVCAEEEEKVRARFCAIGGERSAT
jgi:hypothetical protein